MRVKVKIGATVRYYVKFPDEYLKGQEIAVEEGATTGGILEMLHFPERVVAMIVVNGFQTDATKVLKEGDEIHIMAPLSGG